MIEELKKLEEFHTKFKSWIEHNPTAVIPEDIKKLRYELIREELEELKESMENNDIIGIADALGDLMYVVHGTTISFGLQSKMEDIFNEIHRSNMSKLDEYGEPIFRADGKVLKSNLYTPPNINQFLDE